MLYIAGMFFSIVLGLLLQYSFRWSGCSLMVAFLAPVNGSRFEMLKLVLTPYLLWVLVEYAYYGQFMHAFIPAKVLSLYFGMMLFLLLCRLLPRHLMLTLIVVVYAAFTLGEFLMTLTFMDSALLELIFDSLLVVTMLLFVIFTIYPPDRKFFKASVI